MPKSPKRQPFWFGVQHILDILISYKYTHRSRHTTSLLHIHKGEERGWRTLSAVVMDNAQVSEYDPTIRVAIQISVLQRDYFRHMHM